MPVAIVEHRPGELRAFLVVRRTPKRVHAVRLLGVGAPSGNVVILGPGEVMSYFPTQDAAWAHLERAREAWAAETPAVVEAERALERAKKIRRDAWRAAYMRDQTK